jgi:hypothetical protein
MENGIPRRATIEQLRETLAHAEALESFFEWNSIENRRRALDAWISERLFGYRVSQGEEMYMFDLFRDLEDHQWRGWERDRPLYERRETGWRCLLPFYSDCTADAFLVVEAMRLRGFRFSLCDQPGTGIKIARFFNDEECGASVGDTTDAGAVAMAAQQALCAAGETR